MFYSPSIHSLKASIYVEVGTVQIRVSERKIKLDPHILLAKEITYSTRLYLKRICKQ